MNYPTQAEREAHEMGCEAARNAATWIVDGNSDRDAVARTVAGLDAGDPVAYDRINALRPNLSGEWSGDPTPRSVAVDILGEIDAEAIDEILDSLADAWEAGVDEVFETACETELRSFLT